VNWDTIAFGKNATLYSSDQEWTPEQQAKNDAGLDRIYADFTQRAAEGRKLPLEKLQGLAKGRVWTGEDALANGLVDALGGFPKALELAREAAKLPKDAAVHVQVYPREKKGAEVLAELLGGGGGDNSEDDATQTRVTSPLAPVMEQTREMYKLGVQMGVLRRETGALSADLPETQW
jgi:protease-4